MGKKKIIGGFALFLSFMWFCTVVSKSVYSTRLPMVSTVSPEEKYIEHIVEAEGIVVEGGKQAVTTLSGLKVKSLLVHVGDRVEEGDVLFQIDLSDLGEIIKEKQSKINSLQLQIDAILENQALAEQKKELDETRAREDYDTTSRLEDTDVGRAYDRYVRAEQELEDFYYNESSGMDEEAREEREQELLDALQDAAYGEADAKRERDNAVKQAGRDVEDILLPEEADPAFSVMQLEMTGLLEDLAKYKEISDSQGDITASYGGMITDIFIETGGRVPDSAAMMMTDDNVPCQFKVIIDKEQKKYVGFGAEVSLKLDGSRQEMDATIDYFSESASMPGSFETLVSLPEGIGMPGLSGTLKCSDIGEKYGCCIPTSAVYKDNIRTFIYVLKEREGILGQEYYAEEVNVKILDENESWAAIEGGVLTEDSKVITSADKEFSKGDVVRPENISPDKN